MAQSSVLEKETYPNDGIVHINHHHCFSRISQSLCPSHLWPIILSWARRAKWTGDWGASMSTVTVSTELAAESSLVSWVETRIAEDGESEGRSVSSSVCRMISETGKACTSAYASGTLSQHNKRLATSAATAPVEKRLLMCPSPKTQQWKRD